MLALTLCLALAAPQEKPQAFGITLDPVSKTGVVRSENGATVMQINTDWVMKVSNRSDAARDVELRVWLPPDVRVTGLPLAVRVKAGETRKLPCGMWVEADRRPGRVTLRVRAVAAKDERLGSLQMPLWIAVGRDFARLGFEQGGWSVVLPGEKELSRQVPLTVKRQRQGGAVGHGCLRVSPGEERASHALLSCGDRGFRLTDFNNVTFLSRGDRSNGKLFVYFDKGTKEYPVMLGGGDAWRRHVVVLRDVTKNQGKDRRVRSVHLVLSGKTPVDIDDFAVVRDPTLRESDKLRSLTERYGRRTSADERARMQKALADIGPKRLAAQDLVDYELLRHALKWSEIETKLPRKRRGQPAGTERFEAMVKYRHHLDMTLDQLLERGQKQVAEHQRMLQELAPKIAKGKGWREVTEILKDRHPSAKELPKFAQKAMNDARDFVVDKDLMTVPWAARHARVNPVTSGRLSRTYPFGGYGGARPSARGFTGTYFVSPPADWMNAQQAKDRLRGNHYAKTRVIALHEVIPGHHLQTVIHRMRPLSRFRRGFYSTVFGEGWALYCEELMFERGFYPDDATRFAQLQMRLWRAARIVIDVSLHTRGMSMKEAQDLLVKEVAMDPINAKAEVLRYIDNPTRPLSYLTGYLLIQDFLAKERKRHGDKFDLRGFHDRLLAFGPVPLPTVLQAMRRSR